MNGRMLDSRSVSKEEARKHAVGYVDTIIRFVESIHNAKPGLGFQQPIIYLEELRERIEKASPPLRSSAEVKAYLRPAQDGIIRFLPPIRKQLNDFWKVQNVIIQESNKANVNYDPATIIDRNYEMIMNINGRFDTVLERFTQNPNDEVNIDALFYIHILRTEAFAKKLSQQLSMSLSKYKITNYDPASIYSIEPPITQVYRGKTRNLTDAEALRNALAHNKYKITFDDQTWKVEFDNNNEFGYHYKKEFSQEQFVEYLKELQILYMASLVLIYILTLWAIVTTRLV